LNNTRQNTIHVPHDIIICEADHEISHFLKVLTAQPIPIFVYMRVPVNFDDEANARTTEIADVRADYSLAAELQAI
jgi:hypothetical protein